MVVDTACLLDKESRKALQLMQGLQGTSLIIPRIGKKFSQSSKIFSFIFINQLCSLSLSDYLSMNPCEFQS